MEGAEWQEGNKLPGAFHRPKGAKMCFCPLANSSITPASHTNTRGEQPQGTTPVELTTTEGEINVPRSANILGDPCFICL